MGSRHPIETAQRRSEAGGREEVYAMSAEEKLPRIVELVRVSSEAQKEKNTAELQRIALDKLRMSRPGVLVRRIEALAVSGAKGVLQREDLQELLRLSRAKAYDELRVWNLDRLTRSEDPRERMAVFGMAIDAEAKIVDCTGKVIDPKDTSGMGELDYYLQSFFASRERLKIIARTGAGRRRAAQEGVLVQGSPPYGRRFNHDAKRWELVPHEVETYQRIIREVLAGKSVREIVDGLNQSAIAPARKSKWSPSTVKRLLRVPTIVGEYTVCGFKSHIPPITTREEWDQVRAALQMRRTTKPLGSVAIPSILRGLMKCEACGMTVHVMSDGKGTIPRYKCPSPKKRGGRPPCPDPRSIQVPLADKMAMEALCKVMSNSKRFKAAMEEERKAIFGNNGATKAIATAERALAALDTKIERTLSLADVLPEDTLRQKLSHLKPAREAAAVQVAKLKAAQPKGPGGKTPQEVVALMTTAETVAHWLRIADEKHARAMLFALFSSEEKDRGVFLTGAGIKFRGYLGVHNALREASALRHGTRHKDTTC